MSCTRNGLVLTLLYLAFVLLPGVPALGEGRVKFFSCSFYDRFGRSSHFLFQRTMLMIMLLFSVFLSLLVKSSKSWRDFSESFAISILECERKRRLEK